MAVADRVLILENAYYSVISPEGCASILFRDAKKSEDASKSLKLTAPDVVKLGVADSIIQEPLGGSHNNWEETAKTIKEHISDSIISMMKKNVDTLIEDRYSKFRRIGSFISS